MSADVYAARAERAFDVGLLLLEYRAAAGKTQEALAEATDVSAAAVSAIESGKRRGPRKRTIEAFARALSLEKADLERLEAAAALGRLRGPRAGARVRPAPRNRVAPGTNPYFGWDDFAAAVVAALAAPLVTLTGPPGIGKSRLAFEIARYVLDEHRFDGVRFLDLETVASAAELDGAAVAALGVPARARREAPDSGRLVVIESCERMIVPAGQLVARILRTHPRVKVLATSREPLGVGGERCYQVPFLRTPPAGTPAADLAEYGAAALFVDRASRRDATFLLDDAGAEILPEVLAKLDGVPLFIERVAEYTGALTLRDILVELDDPAALLASDRRETGSQRSSIHALIERSHCGLNECERRVVRRLAIFSAGCNLEAARAVFSDESLIASDVSAALMSLVRKNLVVAEKNATSHFRLLGAIRAFALEKLEEAGEREAIASRHADWTRSRTSLPGGRRRA